MTTFETTWAGDGSATTPFMPDLTNEPAPPDGFYRSGANWITPDSVAAGDPVTVMLSYAPIPPTPPAEG